MANIQPLDTKVVKQLKASIVITSLEQCLEELVKNALDAGATTIDVKANTDQCMVQVTDNGVGIPSSDLPQLAQRHVTSKCHSLLDLHGIRTFGYRGEALASLATMSILHITSKHQSDTDTYMAIWKDGHLIQHSKGKDNLRPGTTVLIPSLFYKFPVRQKHQTTTIDTLKHTLTLFALIFPQVNFTLTDIIKNSKCMVTKKCSSSFGIFQSLFGARFAQAIKAYSIHEDQFRLQGFFGDGVPTKVHQYIYVNHHHIPPSNNDLYKIVASTIQNYSSERLADDQIRKGKDYPLFLIKIDCTSLATFDIPFLSGHGSYPRLTALLERLVLRYLRSTGRFKSQQQQQQQRDNSPLPPRKNLPSSSPSSSSSPKRSKLHLEHARSSATVSNLTFPPRNTHGKTSFNDYPYSTNTAVHFIDRSRLRRHPDPILDNNSPLIAGSTLSQQQQRPPSSSSSSTTTMTNDFQAPKKLQRQDLASAEVVAQVDRKWIVCVMDRLLLLIDQHAADERIQLETMLDQPSEPRFLQPPLMLPSLTDHEVTLAMTYRLVLQHWGIHVDIKQGRRRTSLGRSPHFSSSSSSPHFLQQPSTLVVTRLPHLIMDRCILDPSLLTQLLRHYLHALDAHTISTSTCPPGMMDMLKSKACRGAIMFNDPLTMDQCTHLIKSLAKCRFPFQCAHGRPSVVPLMNLGTRQHHRKSRPIRWDAFVE